MPQPLVIAIGRANSIVSFDLRNTCLVQAFGGRGRSKTRTAVAGREEPTTAWRLLRARRNSATSRPRREDSDEFAPPHELPSSGREPHTTTLLSENAAVQCGKFDRRMAEMVKDKTARAVGLRQAQHG